MQLIGEMERTHTATPTLWRLGHAGFAIRYANLTFYVDPYLSGPGSPLAPHEATNADLILCTHAHRRHMDPESLAPMLNASPNAKVVLPKSSAGHAHSIGVPYERMTTTDNGLRIEYFKSGLYGRVYSAPSAHPELNWTPIGGFPCLGYLIRFDRITIYHAGDTLLYPDLAARLRPYNPSVAILPIAGDGNVSIADGAQLASEIGAQWIVPMQYDEHPEQAERFVEHLLGHWPAMKFKVMELGGAWTIPPLEEN